MWLVRIALKHVYTFIVMAMLIVIMGVLSIVRMPTDIFPDIDIPVVSVIWNYQGLSPEEMEKRIVTNYERMLTTTVNDIEHIESQSLTGIAIVKVFFQPGTPMEAATAQITAVSQPAVRQMPVGATPPFIIRYSASNVPIMQAALESDSMSEQQLFDYGTNFVRADFATIRGTQIPWPYGGRQRQIMVDIDPPRLYAWGLSARDVNAAIGAQNVILPTGTAKMGTNEYPVSVNSSPEAIQQINDLPIKTVRGTTVYVRDVANVHDGASPQTNMVHVGGKRSVLLTILKNGNVSTLDIANSIKEMMPSTLARLPQGLKATLLFDQSLFVRAAVDGVVKEAVIAAGLTALMILIFLGSWRSTLIVIISIPLSILTSISILAALGHSLNVMTLGGMSLAVGILVDDATVEVENIHRNMGSHEKKTLPRAILDGAQQIAAPAFVATLCICIVFVPVAFISGAARSLFVPLAMAVVFAMMMSYFLSRTLVPTLARLLLEGEHKAHQEGYGHGDPRTFFGRLVLGFNQRFDRLRDSYGSWLAFALKHRLPVIAAFLVFAVGSMGLMPLLGRDFFPTVDAGLMKIHARGPAGTRIEESERRFADIERTIKSVVPASEIETLIDNIGTPYSGINLSLSEGASISPADGQVFIALKKHHAPTADYMYKLRRELAAKHPDTTFFFLAPDISTQVLNFGIAAPIDVQVVSTPGNEEEALNFTLKMMDRVKNVPGAADVHLAQVARRPELRINVDRTMAQQAGLSQRDVASDILISLSSSSQVSPSFWLDQRRGVQYSVAVQTPQSEISSIDALGKTPLSPTSGEGQPTQFLSNVATVQRITGAANVTHFNASRTYDIQANVEGTDLGTVADGIAKIVNDMKKDAPRGVQIKTKGQVESMEASFRGLGYGLLFAVLLVYLLMVVNFQSWLDPFIILMALPGAISGIAWMLYLSHTTLSVPALMGSIMCVGVATANSILVVTFANGQRKAGREAREAALAAGMTRLRPVMMTALAMIIGMLPMSLGMGEGGEQNAPLGRAVIGGLLLATMSTLFFVPVMYSVLRRKAPKHDEELEQI
ncbi:MAG: efflux RND transporter permease subunit [Labilithrix sp.]